MQSYIDKHFRHYPDSLWLIRVFIMIFIDLLYNLLVFIYTIERSNSLLAILFIIIPVQSTYCQLIFYCKVFFRNLIFVGLITIYCFLSKVIMSFLLFNNYIGYMNIVYICMTIEIVFHFIWIFIGVYNEIRYQKLIEISRQHIEMEQLIV